MQIVFQDNYILSFQFYLQEEVWVWFLFKAALEGADFEKKKSLNT